ncbi:MAG: hypothetical protein E7439_05535 [Ruminococcaceae bacterium]|nr:hypothetical protein [Oscillospiraceae bacterium]
MKRKITILAIFVCLLTVCLAIPAAAAGAANLTVSDSTPYRGDTITVTVKLSGVGTCTAGSAEVSFGSGLEWTGAKSVNGGFTVDYKLAEGRIIFYSMSGADVNGNLLTLSFKVKNDAAFSSNKIDVTLQINGEKLTASKSVTVTCNHKYSAWSDAGDGKHSRKCSVCGKVDTQVHTFDNLCDTACNDCPATRVTTHSFAEEYMSDETGHWHLCINCGEKSELEQHEAGAAAGEYSDQVCTVCNFVLTPATGHQHSYDGSYKTDGNSHWAICQSCGEATEKVAHEYESDCDETCDVCGNQRQVVHKTGEQFSHNDLRHWKTCADCGQRLEQGDHIWNAGTVTQEATVAEAGKIRHTCVLCGQEREEAIPALPVTDILPWWGWLAVGAGGGALLVILIGSVVIGVRGARAPKGKYYGR